jgi:hypothetical protein
VIQSEKEDSDSKKTITVDRSKKANASPPKLAEKKKK